MKIPRDKAGTAPPGGIHRALGAIAVLFVLLVAVSPAAAQPIRVLQIEGIDGFLEAGFFTSLETRDRAKSGKSEFNRVEMSQILDLDTYGYIYHPRFVKFSGGIQLEAIEGLAGQSDTRMLVGGNFRMDFLADHPNSLSAYFRAQESQVPRPQVAAESSHRGEQIVRLHVGRPEVDLIEASVRIGQALVKGEAQFRDTIRSLEVPEQR